MLKVKDLNKVPNVMCDYESLAIYKSMPEKLRNEFTTDYIKEQLIRQQVNRKINFLNRRIRYINHMIEDINVLNGVTKDK